MTYDKRVAKIIFCPICGLDINWSWDVTVTSQKKHALIYILNYKCIYSKLDSFPNIEQEKLTKEKCLILVI